MTRPNSSLSFDLPFLEFVKKLLIERFLMTQKGSYLQAALSTVAPPFKAERMKYATVIGLLMLSLVATSQATSQDAALEPMVSPGNTIDGSELAFEASPSIREYWIPGINAPTGVPRPIQWDTPNQNAAADPFHAERGEKQRQMQMEAFEARYQGAIQQRSEMPSLLQKLEIALENPKLPFDEVAYLRQWSQETHWLSESKAQVLHQLVQAHVCELNEHPLLWAKFFYSCHASNALAEQVQVNAELRRQGRVTIASLETSKLHLQNTSRLLLADLTSLLTPVSPAVELPTDPIERFRAEIEEDFAAQRRLSAVKMWAQLYGQTLVGIAKPSELTLAANEMYVAQREWLEFETDFERLELQTRDEYLLEVKKAERKSQDSNEQDELK